MNSRWSELRVRRDNSRWSELRVGRDDSRFRDTARLLRSNLSLSPHLATCGSSCYLRLFVPLRRLQSTCEHPFQISRI